MTEVLGFEPSDDIHSQFKQLHDVIFASGKNYTLTEANRIFSRKGLFLIPSALWTFCKGTDSNVNLQEVHYLLICVIFYSFSLSLFAWPFHPGRFLTIMMYITLKQVTVSEKEFLARTLAQDRNSFSLTVICMRVIHFNCAFGKSSKNHYFNPHKRNDQLSSLLLHWTCMVIG